MSDLTSSCTVSQTYWSSLDYRDGTIRRFGGRLSDLHLLISSNGKERTLEEYGSLLDMASLKIKELRDTESLVSIIELNMWDETKIEPTAPQ